MVHALQAFDENGVIVTWNYTGALRIVQSPAGLGLRQNYRYFTPGTWTDNRWIKWPAQILVLSWILSRVLMRQRVRRCFIAGGDLLSWFAQIFKVFGRIEMTITTIEDWSRPAPQDTFYDRINKFKIFINDLLLTSMRTTVVVFPKEIFEARNAYWQNKTLKNSVLIDNQWAWFLEKKGANAGNGRAICYLGTFRKNFGIEILFELLPDLNREHGFRLKMMGPEDDLYRHYKQLSFEMKVDSWIDWLGFVDSNNLETVLQDCFCGVNLQQLSANNSRYVINGRIIHFLQHLLVPVVTHYSGGIVPI